MTEANVRSLDLANGGANRQRLAQAPQFRPVARVRGRPPANDRRRYRELERRIAPHSVGSSAGSSAADRCRLLADQTEPRGIEWLTPTRSARLGLGRVRAGFDLAPRAGPKSAGRELATVPADCRERNGRSIKSIRHAFDSVIFVTAVQV